MVLKDERLQAMCRRIPRNVKTPFTKAFCHDANSSGRNLWISFAGIDSCMQMALCVFPAAIAAGNRWLCGQAQIAAASGSLSFRHIGYAAVNSSNSNKQIPASEIRSMAKRPCKWCLTLDRIPVVKWRKKIMGLVHIYAVHFRCADMNVHQRCSMQTHKIHRCELRLYLSYLNYFSHQLPCYRDEQKQPY